MSEITDTINDFLSLQGLDLTKHVFDHNNLSNFLIECRDHIEKMENQNKLYFHAFNKAVVRIKELEVTLRMVIDWDNTLDWEDGPAWGDLMEIVSKALEGKDELS